MNYEDTEAKLMPLPQDTETKPMSMPQDAESKPCEEEEEGEDQEMRVPPPSPAHPLPPNASPPQRFMFLCVEPLYVPDKYNPRIRFGYFLEENSAVLHIAQVSIEPAGFGKALVTLCGAFEPALPPTCVRYAALAYNNALFRSEWPMKEPVAMGMSSAYASPGYVAPMPSPLPPHNPFGSFPPT